MNEDFTLAVMASKITVYRESLEAIKNSLNLIPKTLGTNDLDKVCAEVNKIAAIVDLAMTTVDSITDLIAHTKKSRKD